MARPKIDNLSLLRKMVPAGEEDEVALIPQGTAPVSPGSGPHIQIIPPRRISDNPYQTRTTYSNIEPLADNMRSMGFQGALLARVDPSKPGYYQLAFGHRRLRAAALAGIDVPVEIRELTNEQMLLHAISENLNHENLTPLEEGNGFVRLFKELGMTQDAIAQMVGEGRHTEISRGYVQDRLVLAQLAERYSQVREYLEQNPKKASIRAMRNLDGLDEPQIDFMLNGMRQHGWTGEQVEQRVKVLKEGGAAAAALLSAEEPPISGVGFGNADLALTHARDVPTNTASPSNGSAPETSVLSSAPEREGIGPSESISKEIDQSVLLSGVLKRYRRYSSSHAGTLSDAELGTLQEFAIAMVVDVAARSTPEQKRRVLQEIADNIQELLSQAETAKT